ncbi:alanine racemase [Corynebacterium hindlerae]|uniref:Alanine racemase n=1 Tax=Corynebacterium hindlerae TaxID=699041 RepID=A0A7G5FHJ2_9CORY|nr:alanine racemase [Corynebacterium hindlerae]QMV86083.1 alanine racemase [Corynebacterium hindlerae]
MDLLSTTIDLNAIAHNVRLIKARVAPAQLMCVVKADGYNHGAAEVARVMVENGADQLGVATLAEAHALADAHLPAPILAWIWSPEQHFRAALAAGISLGIPSMAHARAVADAGVRATVAVKVDTGLNRSGVPEAHWRECFELLASSPVQVTGLFSHLACADDPDDPTTDAQAAAFERALDLARQCGLEVPVNHLANSPATLTRPDLHYQMVRPGLICYGLEPIRGRDHGLKPALTWSARLTLVKAIAAGEGTSYGLTWWAPHDGNYAIVPVGYADGLPRAAQGRLEVAINGKRYPQVGRVCMDQIVVWLGQDTAAPGDEAILFGAGGMSATELADATGTINYEVACWPKGRTVRHYIGGHNES